jgi:predicted metal-dependent enzyme (double-stranded beta helix superfamily)
MCRRNTLRYKDWQIGIAEGGGMKTPDYSRRQAGEERVAVVRFVSRVRTLGPLSPASPALQERLLEEVRAVAQRVDGSIEAGTASGYDRRVLHDDPAGWSLAAIILRPGQRTDAHDHSGWGCAATVQGVERNRRYVRDASGHLALSGERDYPPGTGYIFDVADVHQPVGADPRRVTVALHFLVQENQTEEVSRTGNELTGGLA